MGLLLLLADWAEICAVAWQQDYPFLVADVALLWGLRWDRCVHYGCVWLLLMLVGALWMYSCRLCGAERVGVGVQAGRFRLTVWGSDLWPVQLDCAHVDKGG